MQRKIYASCKQSVYKQIFFQIAGEKEGRRKFFDEVAIFVPSA